MTMSSPLWDEVDARNDDPDDFVHDPVAYQDFCDYLEYDLESGTYDDE